MLPPIHSSVTEHNYAIQETKSIYWRRLIEVGVPVEAANMIAWAIAYYDVTKELPTAQQRALISYYCRFICRAELWRRQLLLHPALLG